MRVRSSLGLAWRPGVYTFVGAAEPSFNATHFDRRPGSVLSVKNAVREIL